jgi:CBS domain-containing protein
MLLVFSLAAQFRAAEQGRITGLITPQEIKAIPRNRWPYTTVDEVLRPLDQLNTVKPEASVMMALEMMGRDDINHIPVVKDRHLQGIISRSHVLQLLQTRAELRL